MAPKPSKPPVRSNKNTNIVQKIYKKYVNFKFVKYLILDPAALPIVSVFILLAELLLNVFVINRVPYTEIDWKAYMQECEGFLNGTTDYTLLKGDTGPLVYPAAFVYIYSALYFITSHGQNIRLAQYIFGVIYLLQMWLVLRLYSKSRKVPPYVLVISAFTSYRIHSIYVLRLFNDPVAILFLYAALNLFMDRRWTWGSICFSLGVGCKMNILLFAPALLAFYLINLGFLKTVLQLAICGLGQLVIGLPFLLTHPWSYIKGSFDLGRIFEHKWTVNYRFLPREIFENKYFHLTLLALHLLLIIVFARPAVSYFKNYVRLRALQDMLQPQLAQQNKRIKENKVNKAKSKAAPLKPKPNVEEKLTPDQEAFLHSFEKSLQKSTGLKGPIKPANEPVNNDEAEDDKEVSIHFDQCTQLALLPFFLCNFIGVMCARSLHYQFYVWYFHSLPYLAWSAEFSLGLRYLLLGLIEFCWNTYPSTDFSSFVLHLCHLILLFGVARTMFKTINQSTTVRKHEEELIQKSAASNGAKMKAKKQKHN
ncbi:lethal(2)neighbour of tid protein 2 [Stomoxys calcitrans]|uniref:dolichyl-P-Man:Man5GlcNAc2-PP-dolichol alpha-1,3-mannosyltransferase n=1 Tax=Stomoxys calcitrans TaxID=35570 RepID=A0A1I8P9L6_STOCA|nr:lethal(2)neighbour of tid protein 2 [Stomoxys calcitrans]